MSPKSSHRLSVVVPAYNEENRLKLTLPHLCKDVRRRFLDYEIIVVDDGSIDDTARVVNELSTIDLSLYRS